MYRSRRARAQAVWKDPAAWHRMALRNIAGMGRFSSDRTIREYADEIWRCPAVVLPG